jgi:hypothetical protein
MSLEFAQFFQDNLSLSCRPDGFVVFHGFFVLVTITSNVMTRKGAVKTLVVPEDNFE